MQVKLRKILHLGLALMFFSTLWLLFEGDSVTFHEVTTASTLTRTLAAVTDYSPPVNDKIPLLQPPALIYRNSSTNGIVKSKVSETESTVLSRTIEMNTPSSSPTKGYAVAVSFWDQQTFSTGNLLSLQCWATHVGMLVPEPFMIESRFKAPLEAKYQNTKEDMFRLSDLYNLSYWNAMSKKWGFAPLATWEQFLNDAPRHVILVDLKPFTRKECSLSSLEENYLLFFKQKGFDIVRRVCFEPKPRIRLSVEEFTHQVFQSYLPSSVIVVFQEWSLHTTNSIITFDTIHCPYGWGGFAVIEPSNGIKQNMNKYISRHLDGGNYITVLVRLEWLIMNHITQLKERVRTCLQKTMNYTRSIQFQTGVQSVFLGTDVGKYGSRSLQELHYIDHKFIHDQVESFIKSLYGNSSSLGVWEETFERITNNSNAGYIGFLQKVISARGKCILLVGNGTFHKHALALYKALHRGHLCFAVVNTVCNLSEHEGLSLLA